VTELENELAIHLLAAVDCGPGDVLDLAWARKYYGEKKDGTHDGDCTHCPYTCMRCVCDEYAAKAKLLMPVIQDLLKMRAGGGGFL
jgi:hypothetical protein